MKKNLLFLGLSSLLLCSTGCTNKLPIITKIDLSDASFVFSSNTFFDGEDINKEVSMKEAYGSSQLCKIKKDDTAERIKINTKNKEDDQFFNQDYLFYLDDIDEKHFSMRVETSVFSKEKKYQREYLVDKETGDCTYIGESDFNFSNIFADKNHTSSARRYINKDEQGNYYGISNFRVGNTTYYTLVKKTIEKNDSVSTKKLSVEDDYLYRVDETFAVDKNGNAAYSAYYWKPGKPLIFNYIAASGKQVTIDTKETAIGTAESYDSDGNYEKYTQSYSTKGFWQGYDGEIYTNEDGYIRKLVQQKNSNGEIISIEQVKVSNKMDIANTKIFSNPLNYIYFDELQEIYLLDYGHTEKDNPDKNRHYELYCIYGDRMGEKVFSSFENCFNKEQKAFQGAMYASEDSIYLVYGEKAVRLNVANGFNGEEIDLGERHDQGIYIISRENKGYSVSYDHRQMNIYDFNTKQASIVDDSKCKFKDIDGTCNFISL